MSNDPSDNKHAMLAEAEELCLSGSEFTPSFQAPVGFKEQSLWEAVP